MKTYEPYEVLNRPTTGLFSGVARAEPGTVLVIDREGRPLRALQDHGDRLTAGEARFGRIRTLYRVDVSERPLEFTTDLPCSDDATGFIAEVRVTCRVADATAVVERGITDVARVLVPQLRDTLRRTARTFCAEDVALAEEQCTAVLVGKEKTDGHDQAFRVEQVSLILTLSPDAARYVRQLKENRREARRQEDETRRRRQAADADAALTRQRDAFEAERARASVEHEVQRLELEKERQRVEAELATQRMLLELQRQSREQSETFDATIDLERKKITYEHQRTQESFELEKLQLELAMEKDRLAAARELARAQAQLEREQLFIDRYAALLSAGDYGTAAMQLLQDPSSVERVAALLAHRRDVDADQRRRTLSVMLENGALEGWQYGDEARAILKQLIGSWTSELSPDTAITATPTPATEDAPDVVIHLDDQEVFVEQDEVVEGKVE